MVENEVNIQPANICPQVKSSPKKYAADRPVQRGTKKVKVMASERERYAREK